MPAHPSLVGSRLPGVLLGEPDLSWGSEQGALGLPAPPCFDKKGEQPHISSCWRITPKAVPPAPRGAAPSPPLLLLPGEPKHLLPRTQDTGQGMALPAAVPLLRVGALSGDRRGEEGSGCLSRAIFLSAPSTQTIVSRGSRGRAAIPISGSSSSSPSPQQINI